MADRYWRGGSGTWNTSSTTNWSTTSGGPGGASVPTAADAVIVDASSGSPTITLTGALTCLSLTTTGATCTFTSSGTLAISGNITLSATTTWSATGTITVNATATVTTNNISMNSTLSINGAGITVTLGSAYRSVGNPQSCISITQGTFNSGNFTITSSGQGVIGVLGTLTKGIILGTSTLNLSPNTNAYGWDFTAATNTTVSAASSTINLTMSGSSNTGFGGGGFTYGTVVLTNSGNSANFSIQGANTFTNLTVTGTATRTTGILITADQTVSGTFTASPVTTGGNFRYLVYSNTATTARTISATTKVLTDVDFRDITASGTAWTGTRLGNAGGNTNITFPAAKTVYWNRTINLAQWTDNAWALSSGGAAATANYPLPQDTIIFSNTGTTNGNTIQAPQNAVSFYQYGPVAITATGMTNTTTLPSITFNNCTFTNTSTLTLDSATFLNRATQTIYPSSGPLYSGTLTLNSPNSSTYQITATWARSALSVTVASGTFSLNGFNATLSTSGTFTFTAGTLALGANTLSVWNFDSDNSNTRAIQFGTGNITVTGTGLSAFTTATATNLTYTGTPTVNITSATTATVIAGTTGGAETNAFNFNRSAGTTATLTAGSYVRNLNFTSFTGTWAPGVGSYTFYGNLTFVAGMTFTTGSPTFIFAATSGTQSITSAGKTLPQITQNGIGGTVSLADTFTMSTNTYQLTNGSFTTNNQTATFGLFSSSNSNTRSVTLGSSSITLTGTSTIWQFTTTTGLTFNAGTSSITSTNLGPTFIGGGLTYRNLSFTSTVAGSTATISGANTFNNLSITAPASGSSPTILNFENNQTINGTLSATSSSASARVTMKSSVAATQRTITAAAVSLTGINFQDINAAGAVIPWTGTSLVDLGNNLNITFSAGQTRYWSLLAGGNWSSTAWATSSGGTPSAANAPIPQDTVIIDDAGLTAGNTITLDTAYTSLFSNYMPTINCTRTNAWTHASGTVTPVFNNSSITLTSPTVMTGTGAWTTSGTGTLTINCSFVPPLTIGVTSIATTTTLGANLTLSTANITTTLTNGTLALGTYTLSTGRFSSTNTNVR